MANSKPPVGGTRRVPVPLVAALGVCALVAAAALAYFGLGRPAAPSRPAVSVRVPGQGAQVFVGQEVLFQAIARSQQRIVRVELWADGQLLEVQRSSQPQGTSPFSLVTIWRPATPGTHTVTARAFDVRGGRSHASVTMQAVAEADRDGDRIADAADACPDDAGWSGAQGCPDADGDGMADADDACPGEAGPSEGNGCPTIAEGDRDGDGTPNGADACPDEPGWAPAQGCPDGDRDGVADARDACRDEPGLAPEGCPPAGAEGGAPAADMDGDGVADPSDLCPESAGPAGAGGCPPSGAGDRDRDGLADDVDLAPSEPGLPEHGGSPPPDADSDRDGVSDEEEAPGDVLGPFRLLLFMQRLLVTAPKAVVPVEFQALELGTHQRYDRVVCYACLNDGTVERIGPLESADGLSWNIAEHLGPAAHRLLLADDDEPFTLRVECEAYSTSAEEADEPPEGVFGEVGAEEVYYHLGTLTASEPPEVWDGRELSARSVRESPPAGRVFHMRYRICNGTCEDSPLPPPVLGLYDRGSDYVLGWTWDGDPEAIDGFTVRCNCDRRGFFTRWAPKDSRILPVSDLEPDCGETCTFTISARRMSDGVESATSNPATWVGDPCPGYLYVDFLSIGSNSHCESGPIYGMVWANAEFLWFDAADPFYGMEDLSAGLGFPHRSQFGGCSLDFQDFFDDIRGLDPGWDASYTAPASSRVGLLMRPNYDLNIGVRIWEDNPEGDDPVLVEASGTIPASHLLSEDFNHSYDTYGGGFWDHGHIPGRIACVEHGPDGSPYYMMMHSDGLLLFELEWGRRPDES